MTVYAGPTCFTKNRQSIKGYKWFNMYVKILIMTVHSFSKHTCSGQPQGCILQKRKHCEEKVGQCAHSQTSIAGPSFAPHTLTLLPLILVHSHLHTLSVKMYPFGSSPTRNPLTPPPASPPLFKPLDSKV